MRNSKSNAGFTLVELLTTIAVGSLITFAAASLLLFGFRINRQSLDTVTRQNETRIVLTALEQIVTEGEIMEPEVEPDSWKIFERIEEIKEGKTEYRNGNLLFSYSAEDQAIYTADGVTPLLENVLASSITINDNAVLTFSIETEEGSYSTSVYCRTMEKKQQENIAEEKLPEEIQSSDMPARMEFLKTLTTQYRMIGGNANSGLVLGADGYSTGIYYSQWYINTTDNYLWDADTPWCACFVSWGLHKIADQHIATIPEMGHRLDPWEPCVECKEVACYHWFASVDRFAEFLKGERDKDSGYDWKKSAYYDSTLGRYTPVPGDIVFIDWEGDRDPDHMAVLLSIVEESDGEYVYTIEGNSAGIVAVRRYPLNSKFVLAYGVIDWVETPVS